MSKRYRFYMNDSIKKVQLNSAFYFFYFKPTLFKQKLHKGLHRQSDLLYLFWYIVTLGKYQILYIRYKKSGELAHFSNILPTIFKYRFMNNSDLQILHCFTYERYRGRQLYSFSLSEINIKFSDKLLWIGSHISNIASIKVIEKIGFKQMFDVEKRTIFGIYYKINE